MRSLFGICGTCVALIALYACTSLQSSEPPNINLSTFTTKGKASKSMVTPKGEADVYDPAQDEEVLAIYSYLRSKGQSTKSLLEGPEYALYNEFFERLHARQTNDLLRHGCIVENNALCRMDPNYIENTIPEVCTTPDFGSPNLSSCEETNLRLHPTDPQLDIPLGDSLGTCAAPFLHIGKSKPKLKDVEALSKYFRSNCEYYSGEIIMGAPLEEGE